MRSWKTILLLSVLSLGMAVAPPVMAGEQPFDLGLRFNILVGNGNPTNDVVGYGMHGHYSFNDSWRLGYSLDYVEEFDIERSPGFLGLVTAESIGVIDSKGTSTGVRIWGERMLGDPSRRGRFFVGAGLGYDSIDIDPVSGPLEDGGTFDVVIDAGGQLLVTSSFGWRFDVGRRNALEVALRAERHFADWQVLDRVSGARTTVDDYTLTGIHFGWLFRF